MFFTLFSSRAKVAQEALEVSPGPKMDPQWVPIWEQNDVQNVVAQLPVGSPGAARAPQPFQHAQGLIFIASVSVSLASDLDFVAKYNPYPEPMAARCVSFYKLYIQMGMGPNSVVLEGSGHQCCLGIFRSANLR